MSLCVIANSDGTLTAAADVSCISTEYQLLTPSEVVAMQNPFANATPNWNTVLWAFSASLTLWAIGLGIGAVVAIMKKAR